MTREITPDEKLALSALIADIRGDPQAKRLLRHQEIDDHYGEVQRRIEQEYAQPKSYPESPTGYSGEHLDEVLRRVEQGGDLRMKDLERRINGR